MGSVWSMAAVLSVVLSLVLNGIYLCLQVMMAPIPHVRTRGADPESPWWEHVSSLKPSGVSSAPHTLDSTARSDFQYRGVGLAGNSRYGCNTYNNPAIIGG
jgi:hypothetical protein